MTNNVPTLAPETNHTTSTTSTPEPKEFDITKYLPFATAGLIFCGVSKLIYYYSQFGVNIVSFLDFGEIITSFLDIVVGVTFIFAVSWVSFLPVPVMPERVKVEGVETSESIKKRKTSLIVNVVMMALSSIWVIKNVWELIAANGKFVLIVLLIFGFGGLMVYGLYRLQKRFNTNPIRSLIILSMIVVACQVFITFAVMTDYREVKYKKKYLGTRVVFNNDTFLPDSTHSFTSDKDNYYIGKTNNYIFIHRSKELTTSVYPMSSVLQIDLKTKQSGDKSWFVRLLE